MFFVNTYEINFTKIRYSKCKKIRVTFWNSLFYVDIVRYVWYNINKFKKTECY